MQPPGMVNCGRCTTMVCRLPALQVMGVGISSGANCSWINTGFQTRGFNKQGVSMK